LKLNIPNKTWNQNSNLTNAINLSNYFKDIDSSVLNFSYSGNTNIDISILNGMASFSPKKHFNGKENIFFTAL